MEIFYLRGVYTVIVILTTVGTVCSQTCAAGECTTDYFPPTLEVSASELCVSDGTRVTLTCPGDLGGPPFNECNNGAWIYPPSSCEVFACEQPTAGDGLNMFPSASDDGTYEARTTITYSCTQGYTLTGAETAVCDAQDTWNPSTVPVCIPSCDLPVIDNGRLTSDGPFNTGDTAAVVCDDEYDLAPGSSSTISCEEGGEWDELPVCYAECSVLGTANSGSPNDVTVNHMADKTITCNAGYSYNQQTSFTVTCMDGNLEGTKPPACYEDCPELSAPDNGGVSGGNMDGETVTFSCNRGYATNDTVTDTCTDGVWDNDITTPTCYAKRLENSITLYCNPDMYIVEIPGGLLGEPSDLSKLLLGSCYADSYDGSYLYANSSYTDCGTTNEVDQSERKIIYRNNVMNTDSGIITTDSALTINVACVFDQDNIVSSTAIIQDGLSSSLEHGGQYDMVFAAYTDASYSTEITENDRVNPEQTIYLRAEVNYVSNVDLFPTRCYATPQPSDTYYLYEDLIDEGCLVTSNDYASGLSTSTSSKQNFGFAMDVFRFPDSGSDSIYVHCEVKVCPDTTACPLPDTDDCSQGRRKRASQLTLTRHVFAGPIRINGDQSGGDGWEMTALSVYSVAVSAVLLGVVAMVLVVLTRRRTRYTGIKEPLLVE